MMCRSSTSTSLPTASISSPTSVGMPPSLVGRQRPRTWDPCDAVDAGHAAATPRPGCASFRTGSWRGTAGSTAPAYAAPGPPRRGTRPFCPGPWTVSCRSLSSVSPPSHPKRTKKGPHRVHRSKTREGHLQTCRGRSSRLVFRCTPALNYRTTVLIHTARYKQRLQPPKLTLEHLADSPRPTRHSVHAPLVIQSTPHSSFSPRPTRHSVHAPLVIQSAPHPSFPRKRESQRGCGQIPLGPAAVLESPD